MTRWFAAFVALVMLFAASAVMAHDRMGGSMPEPQVRAEFPIRTAELPVAETIEAIATVAQDRDCPDRSDCGGNGRSLCSAVCAVVCLAVVHSGDRAGNGLVLATIDPAPFDDQLSPINLAPPTPPPRA